MTDRKKLVIDGDGSKQPPRVRIDGVDGEVTELGVEWDSPVAEEHYKRLWSHINKQTEAIMAGARSSAEIAGRERRAIEETAEARRQADEIFEKHTRSYAKVAPSDGAGS